MSQFIITGLPRSRTAWFAAYFTNCKMRCHHEPLDVEETLFRGESVSDSSLGLHPELTIGYNVLVIERDPNEVLTSLANICGSQLAQTVVDSCLPGLEKITGKRIKYGEINDRIEEIHEYLGVPFDKERFDILRGLIVTQDFNHALKKRFT